jgi:hypothetical protein
METIKRTITTVIFCAVLLLASINTVAQQNTVSIAASGAVVLTFVKPVNAGDPVLQVTDDNNWLNYNLTATSGKKYSIMVQLNLHFLRDYNWKWWQELFRVPGEVTSMHPTDVVLITPMMRLVIRPELLQHLLHCHFYLRCLLAVLALLTRVPVLTLVINLPTQ